MKLEAIEAIVAPFDFCGTENGSFSGDVFENMKNLRLLDTHGAYGAFSSCKLTTLPDELQWLRWKYYRLSSLPVANLHKLVGLEIIDCDIQHLWMGYKFLPNLKFIHLDELFSCESFPDVSGAPNVESNLFLRNVLL
ncbi:hypothetical protein L6452_08382 [Arctium lappa]|uniref:Uncharacterized protein n=1 Tax=Arctium lappa TaxID=4217 RepID=A0ACB9DHE3_ARCLA|nr:hypothetical protein L6452_08382 [Arctium lappa]